MSHSRTAAVSKSEQSANQRAAERHTVALPARLTWKDQRGATRFVQVESLDFLLPVTHSLIVGRERACVHSPGTTITEGTRSPESFP